jgi:DNA mismatch endonuclease, patch repair protein
MTDVHSHWQRSYNMSCIRDKNTTPELQVRSLIHRMGFRFKLHDKTLPGKPDIVLSRHGKVIFVHGCFWHLHRCRYGRVVPRTNAAFWQVKRNGNRDRDRRTLRKLRAMDWQVLVVWECQIRDTLRLSQMLSRFLSQTKS